MRFEWDSKKDRILRLKRGLGFEEAKEVFSHPHHESQKDDDPEQYLVIGWCRGELVSLVYEEREDDEGLFIWLVTIWKSTKAERKLYDQE